MLVSEKNTCISAYSSRGCSLSLFGSYTGSESSFTPLSTKILSVFFGDKTKSSGSTYCFATALVTKKHKYFAGLCEAAGGEDATPPTLLA